MNRKRVAQSWRAAYFWDPRRVRAHKEKPAIYHDRRLQQWSCQCLVFECRDFDRLVVFLDFAAEVLRAVLEALVECLQVQFAEGFGDRVGDGLDAARRDSAGSVTAPKKPTMTMFITMRLPSSSASRVAGRL